MAIFDCTFVLQLNFISMKTLSKSITNLQTRIFDLNKPSLKINMSDVFYARFENINELTLFMVHFNAIPNFIIENKMDCKKAITWFAECYKNEIIDLYYTKRCFNNNKQAEYDDVFYFLYEDLIVDFDTQNSIVRFLFRQTNIDKIDDIQNALKKFKIKNFKRPQISILINTKRGIEINSFKIVKPRLRILDNYNDDFINIHKSILKRLSKKNDKGLVLLHGKPGTGKTSYIKYLISLVKKNVIFLPLNMAKAVTSPDLISILIDNPNSIFIIEDAENLIIDRDQDDNSPVSALLNISDGLLSDCLNIQIICSFNTDVSKIDSALLRKGRLIAKYDFKELEVNKANKLSKKLGFDATFDSSTTLTDIYNQKERKYQQSRKNKIGF